MQSANSPHYTPDNSAEIVIIGSGLAGLAAGQLLTECGHKALILDKGRQVRISTRRIEGFLLIMGPVCDRSFRRV